MSGSRKAELRFALKLHTKTPHKTDNRHKPEVVCALSLATGGVVSVALTPRRLRRLRLSRSQGRVRLRRLRRLLPDRDVCPCCRS